MTLLGHVRDGVVILDPGTALPEGTRVAVAPLPSPLVELPIAPGGTPGSIHLTNNRIYDTLEQEEIEAITRQWNGPA